MTSYGLIFKLCIGLWILSMFNIVSSGTALAFTASWVILDFLGVFKLDKEYITHKLREKYDEDYDPDEGKQETRKEEFQRKLREGQQNLSPAVIAYTDEEGAHHKITLTADGRVEVEGNPDPEIIAAAKELAKGIVIFGPDAIAQEFERQIQAYYAEQKNNDDNR